MSLHVLGVGVSKYAKHPPRNLRYARADAEDLVKVFKGEDASAPRLFKSVNATLLLDEQATKDAILTELEKISKAAKEHDLVILAFAGHGAEHPVSKKFFFLPYDFDSDRQHLDSTAVSANEIHDRLATMPCRVLVLIDACHGGALEFNRSHEPSQEEVDEAKKAFMQAGRKRGIAVIAACAAAQEAKEDPNLKHGVFTHCLLKRLRKEGSGIVSVQDLIIAAKEDMRGIAGPSQVPKTSVQADLVVDAIPIAIAPKKKN